MRSLIGVTAWRGEFPTYAGPQALNTLEVTYSDAVVAAGMMPVIIPNGLDPALAPEFVSSFDGLVLTGGGDIDPSIYHRDRWRVEESDIEIDRFEIALVKAARSSGTPLLAICRGLQLLNVALGGTINQDVTAPATAHEPIDESHRPEELELRRHPVAFEPAGLLAAIFETEELKVNTLHHQGIDQIGPGLVVEARAPDGLIEAARHEGKWWAVGVQWHPERMEREHNRRLFDAFRKVVLAG